MHIHIHHYLDPQVEARLRSVEHKLDLIIRNQEAIMAAIDNLNADLDAITTALATYVAGVQAAIAAAQKASPDPAIDAADVKVRALGKTLSDGLAQLNTPVVVPTPAPTA